MRTATMNNLILAKKTNTCVWLSDSQCANTRVRCQTVSVASTRGESNWQKTFCSNRISGRQANTWWVAHTDNKFIAVRLGLMLIASRSARFWVNYFLTDVCCAPPDTGAKTPAPHDRRSFSSDDYSATVQCCYTALPNGWWASLNCWIRTQLYSFRHCYVTSTIVRLCGGYGLWQK